MKIVGVHGIGHTYKGAEGLKSEWFPALRDGLRASGSSIEVSADDFDMVSYGSLFRRGEPRRGDVAPVDPGALDGWDQAFLVALWQEASALSASSSNVEGDESPGIQGPSFKGRAPAPEYIQRALWQLANSRFVRAIGGEQVLVSDLRQVRHFLHDNDLKAAVLARMSEKIDSETQVIVAHSLGSVIAYEALCANPHWQVDTLITLGSPLGVPTLVFDALTPSPSGGVGAWPNVRHWTNISDRGDIVALEKKLSRQFGPRVMDAEVYNGWHSHDVARYLSSGITGKAIAEALEGTM